MRQVIVSVKDTAAQAFGRPIFVPAVAVALRGFRDQVNLVDSTDDLTRHPEDFELYQIGEFDDSTGIIEVAEPRLIARAKDLKDNQAEPRLIARAKDLKDNQA